ncbi:MAG: hypothetical protein IKS65_08985 [Bacteroidales bacterium]|nr:hypothetical protein [Bacteroidales bacterium]
MKKLFIFIIILAALAIVMKVTVPSPEKHYEVAAEKLTELFKEQVSNIEGMDELFEQYGVDADMLADFALTQFQIEDLLTIKDCFIYNVGIVNYDGKDYPLTIGVFNHIFVTTDYIDEIQEAHEKMEKLKEKYDK